jgi:phage terminase large subunit GpA-like protein
MSSARLSTALPVSPLDEIRADLERLSRDGFCPDLRGMAIAAAELLTPPEKISTTDCAARFRYIPDAEGAGASLWDPTLTPYINPIQDAGDDPATNLIIVPKPGRVGGTIAAENMLFKRLMFGPRTDTLWYLGSDSEVDSYIDRTVLKLFELHPDIQAMVGKGRSDDKRNFKRIMGRILEYLQVNAKTITGRTGGFIVGDEIDAIIPKLRSTFVDQAFIRGTTVGTRFKGYLCSHMDAGWTSGIASAWRESSRGIWYWPCPHCGDFSSPCPTAPKGWRTTLEYERLTGVSDDEMFDHVARTAGLACPHCGSVIENEAKAAMNLAGVWVHEGQTIAPDGTVTGEPRSRRVMGFWIHGTMSPWVSWGDLARRYISALVHFERTRKSERLREVSAKVLGEIYEGGKKAGTLDAETLKDRAGESEWTADTVPEGVLFVTGAADMGRHKADIKLKGWDLETRSWVISRFTITANEKGHKLDFYNRQEDWLVLRDQVLRRVVPFADDPSRGLIVAGLAIDNSDGHVTHRAREFARQMLIAGESGAHGYRVRLVKGISSKTAPEIGEGRVIVKDDKGRAIDPPVVEFSFQADKLKRIVMDRIAIDEDGPGYVCWPADITPDEFTEIFGEVEIDGKWERRGPNESLDLEVQNEVVRQKLGPDRREINWTLKPIWARPVEIADDDGDDAEPALERIPRAKPKPATKPKKSIFEQFDDLNSDEER